MAQKAGKAAPALAVAGVLAVGAHVPKTTQPERTAAAAPVMHVRLDAAILPAHSAGRSYTVRPGDTLSGIALRLYGRAGDWRRLYDANRSKIHNPGLIYPGQVLRVPRARASVTARRTDGGRDNNGDRNDHRPYKPRHARSGSSSAGRGQGTGHHLHGTLNCRGLEALWRSAGGASWAAETAASIAMAESGGHQYATGRAGERGYWQINPVNGALSTYNAHGNARAAVIMSRGGTNWSAWTTWVDGAYRGRC